MRPVALCSATVLLLTSTAALAPAAELSVKRTLSLKGSPEATWSMIADYCGIAKWHPAIAKCDIVKGSTNQPGAVRVLTLQDGARVTEELTSYDVKKRSYSYKILEAPLPIRDYNATMTVLPGADGGSVIDWQSTFDAAPGADPAAARASIEGVYDAGLARLKELGAAK